MKFWALAIFLLASSSASAGDIYQCQYSKAKIIDGSMGPLSFPTPAKVEVNGNSMKTFRPDGSFIISPQLSHDKGNLLMADDGSKTYALSKDKKSFAFSDRIARTTEQWDRCEIDSSKEIQDAYDADSKFVETMSPAQGKKYFLTEKHAFTTNCLVWGDVTMITGKYPAMLIAGSVNMGSSPKWDGKEYTFRFNGGSMIARFIPSEKRHKFVIQSGDKFYGCGPSIIDRRYE